MPPHCQTDCVPRPMDWNCTGRGCLSFLLQRVLYPIWNCRSNESVLMCRPTWVRNPGAILEDRAWLVSRSPLALGIFPTFSLTIGRFLLRAIDYTRKVTTPSNLQQVYKPDGHVPMLVRQRTQIDSNLLTRHFRVRQF